MYQPPPTASSAIYHAKLLLFGEHLLLTGASALAVPVPAFYGQWKWGETPETGCAKQRNLPDFAAWLMQEGIVPQDFVNDLSKGLYFDANIPEGYGLGSSGALCAAIFDRYATDTYKSAQNLANLVAAGRGDYSGQQLADLKRIFARMEGFFHGSSSGIDPLTSYTHRPLLIEKKMHVSTPKMRTWRQKPIVFLIDTQLPRQTGPLVQWYLQQYELPDFRHRLEQELLPAHAQMLHAWLHADEQVFWPAIRQVSRFQLEHFHPMVPATMRDFWLESLHQDDYSVKICGAGGGGFMLGFAREWRTLELLREREKLTITFLRDLSGE